LDCESRGLSPGTLTFYRQKLSPFLAFLQGQGVDSPQAVTPEHVRAYLVSLREGHNAGGTHCHWRALRAWLRFLAREGDITGTPLGKVSAPKLPKTILEPVSLETVAQMLKACTGRHADRDRALLLTLLDSGLRAAEVCALDTGDLDLATGRVLIRHGKGDKGRVVFLGAKARKAVLRYLKTRQDLAPTSPLFATGDGGRLTYWALRSILVRRARAAGVATPSAHDFRRAFALLSLRGGCDIMALQKLMGHASLDVLRRYLAQGEDDLREAHRKSSPVDRML